MALVFDRIRKRGWDKHSRIALFIFLEELQDIMKMAKLIIEKSLPDLLDPIVALIAEAAVVIVNLRSLMHQPFFQPSFVRIDDRLILRDMLLFDRSNFGIELTR